MQTCRDKRLLKYYVNTLGGGVKYVTGREDLRITKNPHLKPKYYVTVIYVLFLSGYINFGLKIASKCKMQILKSVSEFVFLYKF